MFMESGAQKRLKLRRSETLGLVEGELRSSGAKRDFFRDLGYTHLAALRLQPDLARQSSGIKLRTTNY